VLRGRAEPRSGRGAHGERHARLAAEHVAELRRLVQQRVEANADEVDEHELGHRTQPGERGPDRRAHEAHLADRRVAHALGPEALQESTGRAHDPAPRLLDALLLPPAAPGHVLAEDDHVGVRLHREVERLVDGEEHGDLARHGAHPFT